MTIDISPKFPTKFSAKALAGMLQLAAAHSSKAQGYLAELEGKTFSLHLESQAEVWVFVVRAGKIEHVNDAGITADVQIRGRLSALLQSMDGTADKNDARDNKLYIAGDLTTARQLQDFFAAIKPDWDEILSHYLGSRLGYLLADSLREVQQHSVLLQQRLLEEFNTQKDAHLLDKKSFQGFDKELAQLKIRLQTMHERLSKLEEHE